MKESKQTECKCDIIVPKSVANEERNFPYASLEGMVDFIMTLSPHNRDRGITAMKEFVASQRQEIVKSLEGMPTRFPEKEDDSYDKGYAKAFSDAISIINKEQ